MDGKPCSSCGAQNPDDATHCWQCYQSFLAAPARIGSIIRGLNQPRYGGFYGGPAVSAPPKPPSLISAFGKRFAFMAILLFAAVWAWSGAFRGFAFPNYVAGERRIESDLVNSGVDLVQDAVSAAGLDIDVYYAFYGTNLQPRYMLFAAESGEDEVRKLLQQQAPGKSGQVGCAVDGVNSFCMWNGDDGVVGLYGWSEAVNVLHFLSNSLSTHVH